MFLDFPAAVGKPVDWVPGAMAQSARIAGIPLNMGRIETYKEKAASLRHCNNCRQSVPNPRKLRAAAVDMITVVLLFRQLAYYHCEDVGGEDFTAHPRQDENSCNLAM